MQSIPLFHTLMSHLEQAEGSQAISARGLPLSWEGKDTLPHHEIINQTHWDVTLDLLLQAVEAEHDANADRYLSALYTVRVDPT